MSINRASYETQAKSIEQTKLNTIGTQVSTGQATFAQALAAAEIVKQQSLMVQRDLLRDSGDRSPF
jgi:hypothetical protein